MHWYIRNNNNITGPFPTGDVHRFLLLGRITLDDEAGPNKQEWQSIRNLPELIPEVMKLDPDDEQAVERLAAAKRWADERRGERRKDDAPGRIGAGRRQQECSTRLEERRQREVLTPSLNRKNDRSYIGLIVVIILLSVGAWAGFRWVPPQTAGTDCLALAAPGDSLSHCHKAALQVMNTGLSTVDPSYTNMRNANLNGAVLVGVEQIE